MGRIRTIKPEFPQSESIGRLSREARLLFIQLWTLVDDAGRSRAVPRALARLLYPYDEDAADLIPRWLSELKAVGCIRLYEVDGNHYLDIPKWKDHQKIDHPSKAKFPAFEESISRKLSSLPDTLANGHDTLDNFREEARELSGEDQGEDQGRRGYPREERK